MQPQFIKTLIPSGNPNGMKVIELSNWTGKCIFVPRNKIKEIDTREEKDQPGVYFLFDKDDTAEAQRAYIGESESFYTRINEHNSGKGFWDVAIIFTGNLNRALVKYLEFKATQEATIADRYEILNKTKPRENTLSEYDMVSAESYFSQMKFLLSALGYEIFERVEDTKIDTDYFLSGEGVEARAKLLDNGGFLVYSGSLARIKESDSFSDWSKRAREKFKKEGTLIKKDDKSYKLTKDIIFKTPGGAAVTLLGQFANGWKEWKDIEGNTLDENVRR